MPFCPVQRETVEREIDGKKYNYTLHIYSVVDNTYLTADVTFNGKDKKNIKTFSHTDPIIGKEAEESLRVFADIAFKELYTQSKNEEENQ